MKTKLYDEYVMETVKDLISNYGGLRKAARVLGVDAAVLSKWANGKQLPKPNTFNTVTGKNVITALYVIEED